MGWLYMQDMGGHSSPRSYLDNQFTHGDEHQRSTVLASALLHMKVYYAAVERLAANGERTVFAAVCLVDYNQRKADGYIFGYKDMDETMGPYEAECPETILNLLTPTDYPHAIAWREKCRAAIAARKLQSARPLPKPGQTIIFDPPLTLSDGRSIARFNVIAGNRPGSGVLYAIPGGGIARIRNVRSRSYSLINPAVPAT